MIEMLQKKIRTEIIEHFMRKLLSQMILDLEKCPCTFTFMHFQVTTLPEVQNYFGKQFFSNVLHNYRSKFFSGVYWSVLKKVKKK